MFDYYEYLFIEKFKNIISASLNENKYEVGDTVDLYNNTGINKYINKFKNFLNNDKDNSITLYTKNSIIDYFKNIIKNIDLRNAEKILNKLITYILKIITKPSRKQKIITLLISIIIISYNINIDKLTIDNKNNDIIKNALINASKIDIGSINDDNIKDKLYDISKDNIKTVNHIINKKTFDDFLNDIAQRESSNNWKVINRYGYIGKYQFGKIAFKDVNYSVDVEEFKNNPHIFPEDKQDELMIKLLKNNKHYLRRYLKYIGENINGIDITLSGLLASAHLIGNSGIKKFLRSNGKIDVSDRNGTKCSEYLRLFKNYNVDV